MGGDAAPVIDVGVTDALARVVAQLPGGGEARPGQVEMAEAVARSIGTGRHLIVEAGTGTGKSLAYLVPAIVSGRPVVVATATKALQDQLVGRDLPFLSGHVGQPVTFASLKGRSNYLCLQRAREVVGASEAQLALDGVDIKSERDEVLRLVTWATETPTGDRADLSFEPSPRAWAAVSVSSRECPGVARCPVGEACFAERARAAAAEADVIVVNLHLYGIHLATGGAILPDHDVVVIDEAHQLEDVISATAGLELSGTSFTNLARAVNAIVADDALVSDLRAAGDGLAEALVDHLGSRLKRIDGELADALSVGRGRVERVLEALRAVKDGAGDDVKTRKQRATKLATALVDDLDAVTQVPPTDVAWVEGMASSPVLRVAPIDVGEAVAGLFERATVVLTSATIPPRLAARLALEAGHDELDVGSPFEYETHALLYCAAHLPDPRQAAYDAAMHDELEALILAAGGRTLALFTSWRAMRAAVERLKPRLPFRVLAQNDLPKPALVEAFAADEATSLFATMGFWQGIDVPGRSLSLVTIDRLPFPRPDDPLLQARRERARADAFATVDLPRAATLLAQGSGRLIRTADDRGVVAVLDPRLASANYRWDIVRALPPMRRTKERSEVEAFLRECTQERPPQ